MDSQQMLILDYIEISPGVKNMIDNKEYRRSETDSGRTLTDVVLDCREIILSEVTEFGIEVLHPDELLLDGHKCECLATLREFFDEDILREFFYKLVESEKEIFKVLLDDGDEEAQFGLEPIVNFFLKLNPNNTKLKQLHYYIFDFLITKEFYKRMWSILISSKTHEPDDPQTNIDVMSYLQHKFQHLHFVRTAAAYFKRLSYDGELDLVELDSRLSLHDKDLIYGDELKEIVALRSIRKQPDPDPAMLKVAEDQIMCHYKRSRHHMDFFVGQEYLLSLVDIIEILSDIYEEQPTKEEYLHEMEDIFNKVAISDEMKKTLRQYAARFNIWSDVAGG